MQNGQIAFVVVGAVVILGMLGIYARTGKPLRAFLGTAAPGMLALAAVNYTSFFTGVALTLNATTLFTAAFLGLPGVVGIFFIKLIWGIS